MVQLARETLQEAAGLASKLQETDKIRAGLTSYHWEALTG